MACERLRGLMTGRQIQNLVTESVDLMLDIINGKILIVDLASDLATGTAGGVNRAEFNGYKAQQEQELALLKQEMGGGGYTIRYLLFTKLEESTSY